MVRPGIEVLVSERASLVRGARTGLIAHPASVDARLRHAARLLPGLGGARLVRLFAPEHGLTASLQDMEAVEHARDAATGLEVVSLYGDTESSLTPRAQDLAGLDVLVADLQDVGSRYYTFAATVIRTLAVAGGAGVRVVVADRPNPIGGLAVEGGEVRDGFHSFVGELSVANRHGMTLGELCLLAREERRLDVELDVVPAAGWTRGVWHDRTGLPWVLPSPNMPTLDTATVYPGTCLLEGTNLSEGRGTTRPFELIGAPWLDPDALAARLEAEGLPGVAFRAASFRPRFQKHAGVSCGGVQLHVTERTSFRPVLTGLSVVAAARALAPERFRWRTEAYEFVEDIPAFDLLAGSGSWRRALEAGAAPREIAAGWGEYETKARRRLESVSLYPGEIS